VIDLGTIYRFIFSGQEALTSLLFASLKAAGEAWYHKVL